MSFRASLPSVAGGSLLALAPRSAALAMRKELELAPLPID
jgi:hypothetical protein